MRFLGIDVGVTGGIGVLDVASDGSQNAGVYDTPTRVEVKTVTSGKRKGQKKNQRVYDVDALWRLLQRLSVGGVTLVALEKQWAVAQQPREGQEEARGQGVTAAFSIGYGYGLFRMVLRSLSIFEDNIVLVAPIVWKRKMGLLGSGKGKSREMAARMFPDVDFGRRRDEGRAEGVLLAAYAIGEHQFRQANGLCEMGL